MTRTPQPCSSSRMQPLKKTISSLRCLEKFSGTILTSQPSTSWGQRSNLDMLFSLWWEGSETSMELDSWFNQPLRALLSSQKECSPTWTRLKRELGQWLMKNSKWKSNQRTLDSQLRIPSWQKQTWECGLRSILTGSCLIGNRRAWLCWMNSPRSN